MRSSREGDEEFENDVRRIARLIWPGAEYAGAAMEDGKERDGVFVTPDIVHLLECTTSRGKDKAERDVAKLVKLAPSMQQRHSRPVQTWFVTKEEPTAEQREVARRRSVNALSYDQFRSRLIDARTYITLRRAYPFGSVRDLATDKPTAKLDYISLGMTDSTGRVWTVRELVSSLRDQSSRVVLLGDYGAGKSSTLREIEAVEFQDVLFAVMELPAEMSNAKLPSFVRCYFAYVFGRTRVAELDSAKFRDCDVDHFEDAAHTTNAILRLDLPLGTRVLLTVLRKLYAQKGSGRRESALLRGLDHRAQRLVPEVLLLLRREGFVDVAKMRGSAVLLPARHEKARQRAFRMLAEPYSSGDPLIAASAQLD